MSREEIHSSSNISQRLLFSGTPADSLREHLIKVLFILFFQHCAYSHVTESSVQSQEASSADGSFSGILFFYQKLIRLHQSTSLSAWGAYQRSFILFGYADSQNHC